MSTTFVEVAKEIGIVGYSKVGEQQMLTDAEKKNMNCLAMVLDSLVMQAEEREYLQSQIDVDVQPSETGGYTVTITL